jgi:hypothetical protein
MAGPEIWGPPVWCLFHTLAEKVNEDEFKKLFPQMFHFVTRISAYLPCPDCANHATQHFSKIKPQQITCKKDFKNMLYIFHNMVNTRKKKPLYNYADMEKYKNMNIVQVYNRFTSVYHTKGNMQMLSDSFQRQFIVKDFRKWMLNNMQHFQ